MALVGGGGGGGGVICLLGGGGGWWSPPLGFLLAHHLFENSPGCILNESVCSQAKPLLNRRYRARPGSFLH